MSRARVRDLIRQAKAAGWKCEPTRAGHLKFTKKRCVVYSSGTPSCPFWEKKVWADMAREERKHDRLQRA